VVITLRDGALTATILPFGARLQGLWHAHLPQNLLLGYADAAAYRNDPFYLGAIVGPLANRIAGARLQLNGETYRLDANEGPHSLHGGATGLSELDWEVQAQSNTHVTLRHTRPADMDGLPGARHIEVSYQLMADTLSLIISAGSDHDTLFNPAHHPYWRLYDPQAPSPHQLRVAAQSYLPVDEATLPRGDIADLSGTAYDFRQMRDVPVDQLLDATLCLAQAQRSTPHPVAELRAGPGLQLEIETTEPGLQVYNGAGLQDTGEALTEGYRLFPFAGLALEPQGWPNAPNMPHFPSVMLRAGSLYRQETRYRISYDGAA